MPAISKFVYVQLKTPRDRRHVHSSVFKTFSLNSQLWCDAGQRPSNADVGKCLTDKGDTTPTARHLRRNVC